MSVPPLILAIGLLCAAGWAPDMSICSPTISRVEGNVTVECGNITVNQRVELSTEVDALLKRRVRQVFDQLREATDERKGQELGRLLGMAVEQGRRLDRLQSQANHTASRITELKDELKAAQAKIDALGAAQHKQKEKLERAREDLKSLLDEWKTLAKTVGEERERLLDELRENLAAVDAKAERNSQRLDDYDRRFAELEEKLARQTNAIWYQRNWPHVELSVVYAAAVPADDLGDAAEHQVRQDIGGRLAWHWHYLSKREPRLSLELGVRGVAEVFIGRAVFTDPSPERPALDEVDLRGCGGTGGVFAAPSLGWKIIDYVPLQVGVDFGRRYYDIETQAKFGRWTIRVPLRTAVRIRLVEGLFVALEMGGTIDLRGQRGYLLYGPAGSTAKPEETRLRGNLDLGLSFGYLFSKRPNDEK